MKIIDFHTHPYVSAQRGIVNYPESLPASFQGIPDQLKEAGISMIAGSVIHPGGSISIKEMNDEALSLRDALGAEFYVPGFHIHPQMMEFSMAEIARMGKAGVKLIGELVPYMHKWGDLGAYAFIDEMDALLSEAEKYGMAVSFHTMWEWDIEPLLKKHPNTAFIAAHPGERPSVEKHIARMKQYENLHLDLSGTGIFRFGSIRFLVNSVGADRILFGTDYPICNPRMYVHAVLGENLPDSVNEKIFHENAERILGLK